MARTKHLPAAVCLAGLLLLPAGAAPSRYEAAYLKGNIQDKILAVREAAQAGDSSLCTQALTFALSVQDALPGDADVEQLVHTAVSAYAPSGEDEAGRAAGISLLETVFRSYASADIQIAVLRKFSEYPAYASVSLVNSFVTERVQKGAPMDSVMLAALETLETIGNNTSFTILFVADLMGIWPDYRSQIRAAYTPLANECEGEILTILSNVTMEKKLEILAIVNASPHISQKISGEVAENALSDAITNIGEMKDVSQAQLALQLASLQTISDTQWTRAASLATSYFEIARREYESSLLSPEQFSTIIGNIASVASAETGQVLSSYLDFLNKGMERKDAPVEAVVLSVIEALGGLGDKAAFDYLLYVTYLDYPEAVVSAARVALSKLKW